MNSGDEALKAMREDALSRVRLVVPSHRGGDTFIGKDATGHERKVYIETPYGRFTVGVSLDGHSIEVRETSGKAIQIFPGASNAIDIQEV